MASSSDKIRNSAPLFSTTLTESIGTGDTSISLQSVTGLPTGTGVSLTIDGVDSNGNPTPSLREVVIGVVNSGAGTVGSLLRGQDGTSASSHANGATVQADAIAQDWNDFGNTFLEEHTQTGAHTGISNTDGLTTDDITYTGTFTGVNGTIKSNYLINPYKFSAYLSTNASYPDSSTNTIVFNTELFDTSGNYNNTTGVFTTPVNGYYQYNTAVSILGAGGSVPLYWEGRISLYKNTSTQIDTNDFLVYSETNFTNWQGRLHNLVYLNSGDTLQVEAFGDTVGGQNAVFAGGISKTFFSIFLVSEA